MRKRRPIQIVRILVNLPPAREYSRNALTGTRRAAHDSGRFVVRFLREPDDMKRLQSVVAEQAIGGIVLFSGNQQTAKYVQEAGIPGVNISGRLRYSSIPRVCVDNYSVGRIAADHLLGAGLEHFAYAGVNTEFSRLRGAGFLNRVKEMGMSGILLKNCFAEEIVEECKNIKRPFGLLCCFDRLARDVLDNFLDIGWNCPEDVAIMGVDDSAHICEGGLVSLSSVPTSGEAVGYRAAMELLAMIDGAEAPRNDILIPPGEVMQRDSSDVIQAPLPGIADAIRFLRANACNGCNVNDVIEVSGLSRAAVHKHIQKVLGRSPHDEIRHIQLSRAKRLLIDTHLSIQEVGLRSGFREDSYFVRVFRKEVGCTPATFRRKHVQAM